MTVGIETHRHTVQINVAGRTDLRVYLFAVANPVGGVLSAEQVGFVVGLLAEHCR